jgi:hypothetical protein
MEDRQKQLPRTAHKLARNVFYLIKTGKTYDEKFVLIKKSFIGND